jgi:hypothetical protein
MTPNRSMELAGDVIALTWTSFQFSPCMNSVRLLYFTRVCFHNKINGSECHFRLMRTDVHISNFFGYRHDNVISNLKLCFPIRSGSIVVKCSTHNFQQNRRHFLPNRKCSRPMMLNHQFFPDPFHQTLLAFNKTKRKWEIYGSLLDTRENCENYYKSV